MRIQVGLAWDEKVDDNLDFLKSLGVDDIALRISEKSAKSDFRETSAAAEYFARARDKVASHGMQLKTVVAAAGWEKIKMGLPGVDKQLESWCNILHGMGTAGIPILAYNFKLQTSSLLRTKASKGRGAASYKAFDYDEYIRQPTVLTEAVVPQEKMWANITQFLQRAVPAAEKAGVRMALHPDDPPMPPEARPLAGVAHIASTFDHFERIFAIAPSASNGMLFCQGCVKEMQNVDVYDAIRRMGSINKIVLVHFRNVRGAFPKFEETFIDEGDVDMYKAMVCYRDAGFSGPFMMDHCPAFPNEASAGPAFAIGYMRALIQAVYR